jgi:transmembrane sensor
MERHTPSKRNAQVHEAACEWFVEFRTGEPGAAARKAFLAWLQESPAHMSAYLEVTALWNDSGSVNRDGRWTLDALIDQATREPDNIVAIDGAGHAIATRRTQSASDVPQRGRSSHRLRLWALSAAASILVLAVAGLVQWYIQRDAYSTGIGEQRSLVLLDGSTVQLNARSKLRVRFSDVERRVELIRGQALFQVVRNPSRPFVVDSGATRVRAVGTQFEVYQKSKGTVVTVLEGRVAVFDRGVQGSPSSEPRIAPITSAPSTSRQDSVPARDAVYLSAGQQWTVSVATAAKGGVPGPHAVNLATAAAWTQRQLVFESTPLAEVAEEFNRYNERQLVLRDRALEEFQIEGVFSSTDPAPLIRFLRARADVEVTETSSAIVLDRKTKMP